MTFIKNILSINLMIISFLTIGIVFLITLFFILLDYFLNDIFKLFTNKLNPISGNYYFIHSVCNLAITSLTFFDVIKLYQNIYNPMLPAYSIFPNLLTYSLHFYHIIYYYQKLRYDDWLHHILMIFVSLPLGNYFGNTILLYHSLFYLTGLPGMIDYLCLFLVRNNIIHRLTEKKINRLLNLYIRNTGAMIHTFITTLLLFNLSNPIDIIITSTTLGLVFWNGTYFMEQVLINTSDESRKIEN